jgi:MinD-like ATPase involved in chromosome partitioning or flagellar assembly
MTGNVVTFYSYKGGVGRSFALANVAVILAQWGLRVLAVDWDIEAPGLNHYFERLSSGSSPGVLDFLADCNAGAPRPWDHYVQPVNIPECQGALSLMPAASAGGTDYARIAQELNWDDLYSNHNLGARLEDLRARWIEQFDVVLIDSRTGVTDFSGITTVQLPDFLVFFFTANRQSLYGCRDVVRRAMDARKRLPIDRPALVPIPIPSKFELREEYDRANIWRREFATTLREFLAVWLPQLALAERLVEKLLIPYVP